MKSSEFFVKFPMLDDLTSLTAVLAEENKEEIFTSILEGYAEVDDDYDRDEIINHIRLMMPYSYGKGSHDPIQVFLESLNDAMVAA